VVEEALRPMQNPKRIIVVISDGLDRGSKATFEQTLAELQSENIMVYAVQAVDRTRGAIRRDVPKPKVVIDKLAEGTGGQIFSIDEPQVAAKVRRSGKRVVCWWSETKELPSGPSQCSNRTSVANISRRVPPLSKESASP
jgi:hypothetical protein